MIDEQIKRLRQKADTFERSGYAVDGIVKEFRDAANTIETLYKQSKVGEWIPCSERLPNPKGNEEFVRVEVTIQGKEKNVNMPAFYYYRIHKFFPWNIGGSPLKNVIAWMPLPEPYKAGDT